MKNQTKPNFPSLIFLLIFATVAIIIVFGLSQVVIQTTYSYSNQVSSQGSVSVSEGLTVNTSTLNWGELEPGENKSLPILLGNDSPNDVSLRFQVVNWNPVNASNYFTLSRWLRMLHGK